MKVTSFLFLVIFISSFALCIEQTEKDVADSEEEAIVGKIVYELIDNKDKIIISEGTIHVRKSDIQIIRKSDKLLDKMIKLHKNFYFGIASFKEKQEEFSGFGLVLVNRSVYSFSWEWFNVVADGKAVKLQETGNLDFSFYYTDGLVEIDKIYFTSDTTLRCQKYGLMNLFRGILSLVTGRRLVNDDWLCKIEKGSYIYWISDAPN